jgi:DNA repair exonuclease SbcCD ATPase subunit
VSKLLKELKDQISDLETKLAESEKEIERFRSMKNREQLVKENESLKDTIAVVLSQKSEWIKSCEQLKQQLAEKEEEYQSFKKIADENVNYLKNRILEETRIYNQDKISFAIERLEKVKLYAKHIQGGLIDYIDNQIEELKKEMK